MLRRCRTIPTLALLVVVGLVPAVRAPAAADTTAPAGDEAGAATTETVAAPDGAPGGGMTAASVSAVQVDPFQMIGASWVGTAGADAEVRVRTAGEWTPWKELHADGDTGGDGVDPQARVVAEPLWVSSADDYELRAPADATEVRVHLVRTAASGSTSSTGAFRSASTVPGAPATFPRSAWGARPPAAVSYTVAKMAFVHHSAGTNDYSPDEVPSILRAIQAYHMDANGWDDIAYNFLVDRFGRIWEGRGGLDTTVRGGHTGGFNTGSVGVAVLGDYTQVSPSSAAIGATADIIGWVLGRAGVDPMGTATMTAGGHPNSRFAEGEVVTLPAVSGHRDVSFTSCPGALYGALGAIRQRAALRAAQAASPFGSVDSVVRSAGGIRVSGWAIDPSVDTPIDVHAYVGSTGWAFTADTSRPDVDAVFGFGDRHGFSTVIPASAGAVTICLYGINVGAGGNRMLGCQTIMVTDDPLGVVDVIERAPGGVRFSGWALDPNASDSIDVHAYVGGTGVATAADRSRPDLLAWFPDYGPSHGFSVTVPAAQGRQRTCTYGINRGSGATVALRCADVEVEVSPFGNLDVVQRTASGMSISGWAIDPDVAGPIPVHVYSNGVLVGTLTASATRTDVAAIYGPYGSGHGVQGVVTARSGRQTVCLYGINAGPGGNSLIGCTEVA